MDPKVWGKHAWIFLHSITLNYPNNPTQKQINDHYNFFINLTNVIPCDNCKLHYSENIKKIPLSKNILKSREHFIKWLIDIHNEVNIKNNKTPLTYEQVIDYYSNLYNKKHNYMKYGLLLIIIILIFTGYICYKKTKK